MIKAKKSLGQNFLKSEIALRQIVEAGEIKRTDVVLEIGPGKGALTEKLLGSAGLVIAVEKDRELFSFLKEKFAQEIKSGALALLNEDILEFNVSETFPKFFSGYPASQRHHSKNLETLHYKIIANIPYNITGAILKKFLTEKHQPECMVLMVQHEVAKRIVARDKKESILSISVKAYGEPKLIMKVAARYFSPAPKVDSAIIAIKNISRKFFKENNIKEEEFWEIVKTGFAHKRKKLSSNLKNLLKNSHSGENIPAKNLGNKRAEDLTLLDWLALTK
ncbi:MAG: 16S rRNA (adenine(1518)-N(6)/adenine(1519)-N(6))-dimethyltransferase RsmA [Candidatus Paceibacterota bacterium]|jgi:16S rRNA (adenine1518-N6/adenine1519-N6)-dimethyltransferase